MGFWISPFKFRIGFDPTEIEKAIKDSDIFQEGIPSRDIGEFARTDIEILRIPRGEFSEGEFQIFDHMGKEIDKDDAWALKEIVCFPAIILSLDIFDAREVTTCKLGITHDMRS